MHRPQELVHRLAQIHADGRAELFFDEKKTGIESRAYPPVLAVGGLTDPRVTYWEPAKMVAKLRAMKTDKNLLLLKTNMGAGHGGVSGRFNRLDEVAIAYAFALWVVGLSGDASR